MSALSTPARPARAAVRPSKVATARCTLFDLAVPGEPTAPGRVRAALCALRPLGPHLGDVLAVTSELLTAMIRGSGSGPAPMLRVHMQAQGEAVRVTVSASEAIDRPPELDRLGRLVVNQLACRSGSRHDALWAELHCPDRLSAGRRGRTGAAGR